MDQKQGIPTPHIEASNMSDIAKTVLMPGDPLRAKFIADTFLTEVIEFNSVRGMLGYTGLYKGQKISIMGSGMGLPSMGIYSYELYNFYNVENIIRIGSCGVFVEDIDVKEIILVQKVFTESSYAKVQRGLDRNYMLPSPELNKIIIDTGSELNINFRSEEILSGDVFYNQRTGRYIEEKEMFNVVAGEMEAFALFSNAEVLGKKAACILTASDNLATKKAATILERQNSFTDMMRLALESAIKI